jgi:hypothetical protein
MVEHERREPGRGEPLGERAEPVPAGAREAVGDDHDRAACVTLAVSSGRIEPRRPRVAA